MNIIRTDQNILPHLGRLLTALLLLWLKTALAAIGDFESHTDIGNPVRSGGVDYDPDRQEYHIRGAGQNMWFGSDQFQFVWKELEGDFILSAHAEFIGAGVNPHRKFGWMVRSNLDPGSPHVNAVVHGDGLTSLQFRRSPGANTEEVKSSLTGPMVIQLERSGNRYLMSVARFGQPFVTTELNDHALGEKVYVGLFVCSHEAQVIEQAVFKNVRITIPARPGFVPYRDYLGSRLETLDVDTGDRHVLYRTPEAIEAPNWTPDGTSLIYNSKGHLFRFPLTGNAPEQINTGFADHCNNDHVLSFDGQTLGISHQPKEANSQSMIYTLPTRGGQPKQVTTKAPSYLHGWSPDGKSLIYTAQREGDFDIYKISANGSEETRLTTAKGLDDGSEFTPDGKYIYFNSARTGTMQIWRMQPDGTDQEQLTKDEFNNWFPHVSPDGKRVLFLSFMKEVPADQHPYYQHIYLRVMPREGGEPKVVAYVYGGQGTLNVPSWSPDCRRIAFVSHTTPQANKSR